MISFPIRCLQQLLYEMQKWPGVGPRSAQKLIVHLLKNRNLDIQPLIKALEKISTQIYECKQCFGWTESTDLCSLCENKSRDSTSICIVENPFDVFRIESSRVFSGYYHVLHGMVSPLNGVSPEDLTIYALIKRISKNPIKELIIALDTNIEGDTTCLYLVKKLKSFNIKISKLALGIPQGSHLDFVDDQTLSQAIENRVEV